MRNYKTKCNILSVITECSRIPVEGLWTNFFWFLWIRVEVLCEALLVKHKYGHTQTNQAYMNDITIWINARYNVKERQLRESGSNANTEICFEVRAHSSTSPPSHRRISTNSSAQDFPHREPPLRIWVNTNWEYTTPLSNTNTTYTLRGKAQQTQSPLHLERQALSQIKINLSQEG